MFNDDHFPGKPAEAYIKAMATQLRTSEKVIESPILRSEKWTESCYEMLAEIIKKDLIETLSVEQQRKMGPSLSYKTLRKIMLGEYKISYPVDPRQLNTLNKMGIFLGYNSWEDFKNKTDVIQQAHEKIITEKNIKTHNRLLGPKQEVTEVIKTGIINEYNAYYKLPEINEADLIKTHIKNGPAFNLIMDVLIDKKERLVISNSYNPSVCELLDIKVKKIETTYALVYTKEYWLLCWRDISGNKYVQRYKNISDHFYVLNKVNGNWKIKTNASTGDPMDSI